MPNDVERSDGATEHAVVIAGGGPTGLMLAGELALAGVDVAIVERRANQQLVGTRAGGLHARTIEVLDQRGIADRFLSAGQVAQVAGFAWIRLDISDFPSRHPYGLALRQNRIEEILAGWVEELEVPIYREREVTGFTQDDAGVEVTLADGQSLRAQYLIGCDGGRSVIRKAAGIDFPGWDATTSNLLAEVELTAEPEWGLRRDEKGIRAFSRQVLESLPIEENSDDFLFDNEMLAQAIYFNYRVGEISCPTKYFAEASSINFRRSVQYGFGVLGTTLQFALQKWGLAKYKIFDAQGRKLETTTPSYYARGLANSSQP